MIVIFTQAYLQELYESGQASDKKTPFSATNREEVCKSH